MIDYDKIRVVGDVNVDLPLRGASLQDTYILREAEGITAPEFNMQIANTLYQGGVFQNRQSLNRQVVLNIRLNPNYGAGETVKILRQNMYKMLSPRWGRPIKVQLMLASTVVAEIEGHVSGMPMNPFVKDPEIQVVIDCLSSRWSAPTPVNFIPASPSFPEIEYEGSAPVGFWMQFRMQANTNNFEIRHVGNTFEKVKVTYGFLQNDILTIDTRPGLRSITVTRNATPSSILSALSPDSKWIELYEGTNNFQTITTNNLATMWVGVTYTPEYWGA